MRFHQFAGLDTPEGHLSKRGAYVFSTDHCRSRHIDGKCFPTQGQTPPSQAELSAYVGLHKAAAHGSLDEIRTLLMGKADPNLPDKAVARHFMSPLSNPAMTPFGHLFQGEATSMPLR